MTGGTPKGRWHLSIASPYNNCSTFTGLRCRPTVLDDNDETVPWDLNPWYSKIPKDKVRLHCRGFSTQPLTSRWLQALHAEDTQGRRGDLQSSSSISNNSINSSSSREPSEGPKLDRSLSTTEESTPVNSEHRDSPVEIVVPKDRSMEHRLKQKAKSHRKSQQADRLSHSHPYRLDPTYIKKYSHSSVDLPR